TDSHMCGLLIQRALGVTVTAVSYRGTGPGMNDLLGNTLDIVPSHLQTNARLQPTRHAWTRKLTDLVGCSTTLGSHLIHDWRPSFFLLKIAPRETLSMSQTPPISH